MARTQTSSEGGLLHLPAAALEKIRTACRYFDSRSLFGNHIPTIPCPTTCRSSNGDRGTFQLSPDVLASIVGKGDLDCLERIGGVSFVASALETDARTGIQGDSADICRRVEAFGSNAYETGPKPPLYVLGLSYSYNAIIRRLIVVPSFLNFFWGAFKHFYNGEGIDYKSVISAGLVGINSGIEHLQVLWLERLSMLWLGIGVDHRKANVVRSGRRKRVLISDVVVGDLVFLKTGDYVPADGLLWDGWVKLYDKIIHVPGKEALQGIICGRNPFLHAAGVVTDGRGTMLVTSVGSSMKWANLERCIDSERIDTRAKSRLEIYAQRFGVIGPIFLLVILLAHNVVENSKMFVGNGESSPSTSHTLRSVLLVAFPYAYICVPVCWHLIPPLTASYLKQTFEHRLILKNLGVREAISFARSICLDKTGILTSNQMKVADFCLGYENFNEGIESIAPSVLNLIIHGMALNTTSSITKTSPESQIQVSGSPVDSALLSWVANNLCADVDQFRQGYSLISVTPYCPHRRYSKVVSKANADGTIDAHCKGDAATILALCSHFYNYDGTLTYLNDKERINFHGIIEAMSMKSLRCIALAHTELSSFSEHASQQFSLLGILGIRDQCRSGVKDTIRSLQHMGVDVKMFTSDNIFIAKNIATECGILGEGDDAIDGAVVEGKEFRRYTSEERQEKVDIIKVLVDSTPEDKLLMVKYLKQKGSVVAVMGGGIYDQPALKEADVGISIGFGGTDFSQESSDVIVLDNDLASVKDLLRNSRYLCRNFRKLVQFQLTFIISAVAINIVCMTISGAVAISEVHLSVARTVVIIFGHVTLLAGRPANNLSPLPSASKRELLVTNIMWRNIMARALYQVSVLVFLHCKDKRLFGVSERELGAFLFNIFILCQLFDLLNLKALDGTELVDGTESNSRFLLFSIGLGIQAVMLESEKWMRYGYEEGLSLSLEGWGISIAVAAGSYLLGCIVDYIPVPERPFFD